jgi:hypothetical protein
VYSIVISTDEFDIDLYDLFVLEFGAPTGPVELTVTVQSGVLISGSTTLIPGLTTGTSWVLGSVITLINDGIIAGRGGDGGAGGTVYDIGGGAAACSAPTAGEDGGLAMQVDWPILVDNSAGIIMGGNGGGGGGGSVNLQPLGGMQRAGGSGGGGGWPYGVGGLGGSSTSGFNDYPGYDGVSAVRNPTFGTSNDGGATVSTGSADAVGGAGGDAWNLYNPAAGADGVDGYLAGPGSATTGAAGGAAGACIDGNSNITWIATGDRYGSIS